MKVYKLLLPYLKQYRGHYIAGAIALIVASGSQLIIPQFIRAAIDIISYGNFALSDLIPAITGLMIAAFAIVVSRLGWRFFIHGASRRIEGSLRSRLFAHWLKLSPGYFNSMTTGDLMARATNDLNAVRMASGMALVAAVDGLFMTIAIVAILFIQSPTLAAYTIIPFPLITVFILTLGTVVGKLFRGVQDSFAEVSSQAQEVLSGVAIIQAYAKENYFNSRFGAANLEYQHRNMKLARVWGLFMPVISFLSGITTLLLLRFGGEQVILYQITPGTFVATLGYLQLLIWPMMGAGWTVNLLQRGAASLSRIQEVLSVHPEITQPLQPYPIHAISSIEIRNLTFRYSDDSPAILHDISMHIPPGSTIGILGRTGSGKSTLVQLLCRMYNAPVGSIFINAVDILQADLHNLRANIGVVGQNSFLFSATMRENIGFGLSEPDQQLVQHSANLATISRDIQGFPLQWETPVGERGITLSGGQKQRTTIARALAVNPSLLILDDALSAVDTETEEQILNHLFEERRGKNNIIISHRVSTLSHADFIYVLDHGRIIQQGTHFSLSTSPGLYRDIVHMQQLDSQHEERT